MEITIFKKNEITACLFKNQRIFKYCIVSKNEEFGNYTQLDATKCKIDLLDKVAEKNRRAAAKFLHEYELVKIICKKNVISRAYFKLYEIIYNEPILSKENMDCFFICEAPGGFIECITDIRRKKNLKTNYITISKFDPFITYDRYLEENNILYGDITNIKVIDKTINSVLGRFPNGLDIVTADGGFDVKNYNGQEILTSKLIISEIYLALKTQKAGGYFVIKFFDMFTHNSIVFYMILCSFYEYVRIIKPKTSRNCNSERYLVCCNFHGSSNWTSQHEELIENIRTIVINFKNSMTVIFPDIIFNENLKNKLKVFNNLVIYEQIKTINESIKMVNSKNFYFQNLLLKIFSENSKLNLNTVMVYKNILQQRINKCINFLKSYNIIVNQFI